MDSGTAVRVAGLRKSYGELAAVDGIDLEIGAGFDVAAVNGGHGLSGMRERLSQVGGTVLVRSAPGSGI
jgi:glucose-6-phosphate-specific signal transduction histidine kinase